MGYDSGTLPPHLVALVEQIAATDARLAQLDRELAALRAGRLLDLSCKSMPAVDAALDAEDTAADVLSGTGDPETPPVAREAAVTRPTPQRGLRSLRQPGRPAKKHQHSHHRGH